MGRTKQYSTDEVNRRRKEQQHGYYLARKKQKLKERIAKGEEIISPLIRDYDSELSEVEKLLLTKNPFDREYPLIIQRRNELEIKCYNLSKAM